MKTQLIAQERINRFTKLISKKIDEGFVIVECNDKLPYTVLYKEGKKINHGLNFLACCFTLGMWTLPWLYLSQVCKDKKVLIAIDEDGNIFEENCYLG